MTDTGEAAFAGLPLAKRMEEIRGADKWGTAELIRKLGYDGHDHADMVPLLVEFVGDRDYYAMIRTASIGAIRRIGIYDESVYRALVAACVLYPNSSGYPNEDTTWDVLGESFQVLSTRKAAGDLGYLPFLEKAAENSCQSTSDRANWVLMHLGHQTDERVAHLASVLRAGEQQRKRTTIQALAACQSEQATVLPLFLELLHDEDEYMSMEAWDGLSRFHECVDEIIPVLREELRSPNGYYANAIRCAAAFGERGRELLPELIALFEGEAEFLGWDEFFFEKFPRLLAELWPQDRPLPPLFCDILKQRNADNLKTKIIVDFIAERGQYTADIMPDLLAMALDGESDEGGSQTCAFAVAALVPEVEEILPQVSAVFRSDNFWGRLPAIRLIVCLGDRGRALLPDLFACLLETIDQEVVDLLSQDIAKAEICVALSQLEDSFLDEFTRLPAEERKTLLEAFDKGVQDVQRMNIFEHGPARNDVLRTQERCHALV